MRRIKTVSWFSAGVSSAVATKLIIDEIDEIIYTHIDDQHEDTMRFVKDCEAWFGKPVTILQSHHKSVSNALYSAAAVRFPKGAPCTSRLKQNVRKDWERDNEEYDFVYVWGMDIEETKPRPPKGLSRVDALRISMPEPRYQHRFPLVEASLTKSEAHEALKGAGIKRPAMYDLGYLNNNCIGCVKGARGYWNKIRVDFPEVFAARARMEREIGGSILKTHAKKGEKSKPLFLDELDPNAGRNEKPICDDCGIMCELFGSEENN